ncbi:MAG: DUF4340 domain-containing protein, partial [Spirochaetes bacterium]|nr:DUF4340 domain-containing protein [Spirochaetota bacterium]
MNKKLIISLGVIAALILYLIFVRSDRAQKDLPELSKWEKGCTEILIDKKGTEKLRIYKIEDKWVIGDQSFPASKVKVDKFEYDMKELTVTDFISDGSYYDRYDLTPEKAIRVTVKGESGTLRDVILGKRSSTRHTYIKFPDKKQIYLAIGSLTDDFDKNISDLRDREIVNVDRDSIESFELVYKGKKLSFTKVKEEQKKEPPKQGAEPQQQPEKTEKWICSEYKSTELNKNKVDSFAESFGEIRADDFPDIKKETLTASICTVKGKALGKEIVLNIHKPDND